MSKTTEDFRHYCTTSMGFGQHSIEFGKRSKNVGFLGSERERALTYQPRLSSGRRYIARRRVPRHCRGAGAIAPARMRARGRRAGGCRACGDRGGFAFEDGGEGATGGGTTGGPGHRAG